MPLQRDRVTDAFACTVPAGRYRLSIEPSQTRFSAYLLPFRVEVEVPVSGLAATYDVRHGGRIAIDLLESDGTHAAATFRMQDAEGRDVTPRSITRDAELRQRFAPRGALQATGINEFDAVFAAGSYQVTLDVPGHAPIHRIVAVEPIMTSRLTIRLP